MKKYLIVLLCLLCWHVGIAQEPTTDVQPLPFNWLDLIIDNWASISAIAFYIIYRLIPTAKADRIKAVVDWLWNLIPDRKKGGGTH